LQNLKKTLALAQNSRFRSRNLINLPVAPVNDHSFYAFVASVTVETMLGAVCVSAGQNWPQFRGPNGDGTSTANYVPLTWSESNNLAWKVAVPGRGRSSPVVLKDQIWLTTAIEQGVERTRIGSDDMQTAEHVSFGGGEPGREEGKEFLADAIIRCGPTGPGALVQ